MSWLRVISDTSDWDMKANFHVTKSHLAANIFNPEPDSKY